MAPGKNHKAEGEFDAADKNHKAKVEGSLTARVVSAAAKRAKLACRRHKRSAFKEKGDWFIATMRTEEASSNVTRTCCGCRL